MISSKRTNKLDFKLATNEAAYVIVNRQEDFDVGNISDIGR